MIGPKSYLAELAKTASESNGLDGRLFEELECRTLFAVTTPAAEPMVIPHVVSITVGTSYDFSASPTLSQALRAGRVTFVANEIVPVMGMPPQAFARRECGPCLCWSAGRSAGWFDAPPKGAGEHSPYAAAGGVAGERNSADA